MARIRGRELSLDKIVANEKEFGLQVAANAARVNAKLQARSSGKMFQPPRRDPLADRNIVEHIQRSIKAGARVRFGSREGPLVRRLPTPMHEANWKVLSAEDRKTRKKLKPTDSWIKTMWLPHPDHTGNMLKALSWGCSMSGVGARSLTLHLGDEVIDAAKADPLGFVRHMQMRMARELKRAFRSVKGAVFPEYFFTVEDTDLGRPHVHGGIQLPNEDPAYLGIVREALKKAGGNSHHREAGRQLHMPELETPARWVNYLSKWVLGSAVRHDGGHFAATNGIRRQGRAWYVKARSGEVVLDPKSSWSDFGFVDLLEGLSSGSKRS
ncbi:hypothetical protein [Brevundimonas sp.]|uniref:hypothetical protein n=1 Tax=Brevundimonas sp. TaxID=1871086 RepID=UPI0027310245|nr:hypothetical protein [Brevundimonas sp.]MDP1912110.1 hypothetical protein [Brevundimonas sp.]